MNWDDWVNLTNFMKAGVSHNLRAWRYALEAFIGCGQRRLWMQRLARRASHELSWLSLGIFLVHINFQDFKVQHCSFCHEKSMAWCMASEL